MPPVVLTIPEKKEQHKCHAEGGEWAAEPELVTERIEAGRGLSRFGDGDLNAARIETIEVQLRGLHAACCSRGQTRAGEGNRPSEAETGTWADEERGSARSGGGGGDVSGIDGDFEIGIADKNDARLRSGAVEICIARIGGSDAV